MKMRSLFIQRILICTCARLEKSAEQARNIVAAKKHVPQHDFNSEREALEKIGREKFGVKELDDWYSVSVASVFREAGFIKKYGSLFNTLKRFYPQHNWDALRFAKVPSGSWKDVNLQRAALHKLGREQFGVKELDDWYSVPTSKVCNELSFIRNHYNGSLYSTLKRLYPQHDWDVNRFTTRHSKTVINVHRDALERIGREKFGVKELDDWYAVSAGSVQKELGLIKKYGSLFNALKVFYPQHKWDPIRFAKVPSRSWNDENTQREALQRLGREVGVKELDDWYSVSPVMVRNELSFLNNYYKGSLVTALMKLYPQHKWDPNRFLTAHVTAWTNENIQREALEKFGREKLGVKELDDWYAVSAVNVHRELGFLSKYGSLFNTLKNLYPEHDWDPLKFSKVPNGYWQQSSTVKYYHNLFTEWKKTYNIRCINDWHSLHPQQVMQFKRAAKGIFGSRMKMLEKWFPEIVWHSRAISETELQRLLKEVIVDSSIKHYQYKSVDSSVFVLNSN